MKSIPLTAACLAVILVACDGTRAWAGDGRPPASDRFDSIDGNAITGPAFDGALVAGPWTFRPVAGFHPSEGGAFDQPLGVGRSQDALIAKLGFHGAAKVDSRIGAIFSRLSLSFEHEFRANQHRVITGPAAARPTGFYGDRSEVDVMTADAVLAMRMSGSVFGYVEYGAEMEPGGAADHQVILRLRFDF